MNYIETKPVGETHFSHFAVDYSADDMKLNGRSFPLGKVTHDIISLPEEWIKELFFKGDNLYSLCTKWKTEGYSKELFKEMNTALHNILDFIKDTTPFSYFDIKGEYRALDNVFNDKTYDRCEKSFNRYGTIFFEQIPFDTEFHGFMQAVTWLLFSYIFITADTLNFCSIANMFYANLTGNNKYTKPELAEYVNEFFNNPEAVKFIEKSNHTYDLNNFTLHPTMDSAPIVIKNGTGFTLGRRMFFNRILNFYVTDMFEGLRAGHYSRQCGICHKYFFMTTARHQLYCSTVNPDYGYPCAYIAKNKKNMQKQKKEDGFGYDIWKKRCNSIRREKYLTMHNMQNAKYDTVTCDKATQIAKRYFETAQIDFDYAEKRYENDMELKNIFNEAKRQLGKN